VTAAPLATGRGAGKVILLGEHAVVYGHPALAAAIDADVTVTATAGDHLHLCIPDWRIDVDARADHASARALCRIADALGAGRPALALHGVATVPAAAGLGSSAALAVAVARALAGALGLAAGDDAIGAAANAGEVEFHHRPSGVDVALAMHGGLGVFRRGAGLSPLVCAGPVRLAIGFSPEVKRSTAAMVDAVAAATGGDPEHGRLVALGHHAAAGAAALRRGDLVELGGRFYDAHAILADLGVSTGPLDELVATARAAGALGAKLTGAGGGGAVIALAPGREDAVVAAWRARGRAGRIVTLG
jgi:mevalonate kinase